MSLSVLHAALHKIDVDTNGEVKLSVNHAELPASSAVEGVAESLSATLECRAKSFAGFDDREAHVLSGFLSRGESFISLSCEFAKRFTNELSRYPMAKSGLLFLAHYQQLGKDYFLAAFLPQSQYPIVNDDLIIDGAEVLNLEGLKLAMRVSLQDLELAADKESYIEVLNQRTKSHNNFWLDVLDAHAGLDVRIQNIVLVQAIKDYAAETCGGDKEDESSIRRLAFQFCNASRLSNDPIVIDELSNELPVDGVPFHSFVESAGYELADSFPAQGRTLNRLVKFQGAGGGLKMEFEQLLLNERIFYDVETDTLTVKGVPPNLRDQLVRSVSAD